MTIQTKQQVIVPGAAAGENPVAYAERLSAWYSQQINTDYRKELGIYFTPGAIARHMGRLCRNGSGHFVKIADPAAGTGILGCAAAVALAEATHAPRHIELVCYEIDPNVQAILEGALEHLKSWLSLRQIKFHYRVECSDFLLANAAVLDPGIFGLETRKFDAVICNPPYFKIPKSDPRARACQPIVHGQPNVYGLFMAVASALLREGGRFVFITPRSYASGPYFQRFREYFFKSIRPSDIHVFDSRKDAFSDVLQETAITAGTRLTGWEKKQSRQRIRLSSSTGAIDIESAAIRTLPLPEVLRGDCSHRMLCFPASKQHDRVWTMAKKWSGTLRDFGWEVSTGPVVAFRAQKFLRDKQAHLTIPLLWLQNVAPMDVRWPVESRKSQFLLACSESAPIVIPNGNYVVLRRFSAKEERRRLTAAPLLRNSFAYKGLALENHLNYIHKPGGALNADEVYGLAALLNSELFDTYFRISSGNTQVSATELRALRLPPLPVIRDIGKRVRATPMRMEVIVHEELGYGG